MCKLIYSFLPVSLFSVLTACGGGGGGSSSEEVNTAPTVSLAEAEITASSTDTITLDASASSDDDGDTLTFSWDGSVDTPTASVTTVSGLAIGEHSFTVTVSDGEDESTATVVVTIEAAPIFEASNLSTGTRTEPMFAYYDLDNDEVLTLTESEAAENDDWDIAFNRTKVYLNSSAAIPTSLYFLGNTDEFYDVTTGEPVLDRFLNATAESELAAFEALDPSIPDDSEFNTDETVNAIEGWYNYDFVSHTVSAADDQFFIVDSDGAMTKFNVSDMAQNGMGLDSITLMVAYQASGQEVFADDQSLTLMASDCDGDSVYIDFYTNTVVTSTEGWDLSIACVNGLIGFEINIADDALAMNDQDQTDQVGIPAENFFTWVPNVDTVLAYVEYGDDRSSYGWGEYGLNGGFLLWQNFAAYIIKTDTDYYKFQITSYYDSSTLASGAYSFRYQKLTD